MSYVIIGIHGLANKPPREKHSQDWVDAIKEGLLRNCSLQVQSLNFSLTYWADINYSEPVSPDPEPYIPTPLNQPIKTYREGYLSELRAYTSEIPEQMIQKAKEWFGFGPITEAILGKKLRDLDK